MSAAIAVGQRVRANYLLTLMQVNRATCVVIASQQTPIEIAGRVEEISPVGTIAVREDQGRGLGLVWVGANDIIA